MIDGNSGGERPGDIDEPLKPKEYPKEIDAVRHMGGQGCLFIFASGNISSQDTPGGVVIDVSFDLSVTASAIRKHRFCEILLSGHQGETSGGISSQPPMSPGVDPPPGVDPTVFPATTNNPHPHHWIPVFPNENREKEMREAFNDAGCSGACKIFNYACAAVTTEDLDEFNRNRKQIKRNTGCRIFGLYKEYFYAGGSATTA